ncbi:hypothetical protein [Acetoanaerobium noterae]|uniref:hypothetical protein n=1 Tax=Acetoanaerobium noterae TaxID=745369 RepID=UPI00333E7C53
MNKYKGSALIYVIIALIFVSILGIGIATMSRSNILQAKGQKENREGYYLARSGAELMYEHLKSNNLMSGFINNNTISGAEFTDYEFSGDMNGKVDVTVSAVQVAGGSLNKIVTIESKAKLDNTSNEELLKLRFELVISQEGSNASTRKIDSIKDFKWLRQ